MTVFSAHSAYAHTKLILEDAICAKRGPITGIFKRGASVLLLIILYACFQFNPCFSQDAAENRETKIYMVPFKYKNVSRDLAESIRKDIRLYISSIPASKIRLLWDEDWQVVINNVVELQAFDPERAEKRMEEIAGSKDIDEFIYGTVSREGAKIRVDATNLAFDRRKNGLTPKSIVKEVFYESNLDHFAGEIAKKLIDPSYSINRAAIPDFDAGVKIESVKFRNIEGQEIGVINFGVSGEALGKLMDEARSLVKKGDDLFVRKDFTSSIGRYEDVMGRIASLTAENREKLDPLAKEMRKRIVSAYANSFKTKLEDIDGRIAPGADTGLSLLNEIAESYAAVLDEFHLLPEEYRSKLGFVRDGIVDRIRKAAFAAASHHERAGSLAYREQKFEKADNENRSGLIKLHWLSRILPDPENDRDADALFGRIMKKQEIVRVVGENYLEHRVRSLLDWADYYVFQKDPAKKTEMMDTAKRIIEDSEFRLTRIESLYNARAAQLDCALIGGPFPVKVNGKWGYIDRHGKMVIQPKYSEAFDFREGLTHVFEDSGSSSLDNWRSEDQIIDIHGNSIGSVASCDNIDFHEGFGIIDKPDSDPLGLRGAYFVDRKGLAVIPSPFTNKFKFQEIRNFSEGKAAVKINGKWGYVDRSGTVVIQPKYSSVDDFNNGLACVIVNDKTFFRINHYGKIVGNYCDEIEFVASRDTCLYLLNETEEEIIQNHRCCPIRYYDCGITKVKVFNKIGYVDRDNKYIWVPTE